VTGPVTIRAFDYSDAWAIDLQASQIGTLGVIEEKRTLKYGMQLAEAGPAWTVTDAAGAVLLCAGLGVIFPDRQAVAWALIADMPLAAKLAAVRAIGPILDRQPLARIEALAREVVPAEGQFLRLCGFRLVAQLAKWGPLSETYELYERVR
jgi:hypothetical protein